MMQKQHLITQLTAYYTIGRQQWQVLQVVRQTQAVCKAFAQLVGTYQVMQSGKN
jgi:hypothetical protein